MLNFYSLQSENPQWVVSFFFKSDNKNRQEQRDADLRVREIMLRFDMLKLVSSETDDAMETNKAAAKKIYDAFKDDPYFHDIAPGIQEENIQTLGYMRTFRGLFDLRETVDKVTQLEKCFLALVGYSSFKCQHHINTLTVTYKT